jgi:hypothetical protein
MGGVESLERKRLDGRMILKQILYSKGLGM